MKKEDYLRNKGLLPKDFGFIYTFKSNREGVSEIQEHLIWDKTVYGRRIEPKPEAIIYGYKLKEAPYSVQIDEDREFSADNHLCTGYGDCWIACTFASLNKETLEGVRDKESKRIKEIYGN